MTEKVRLEVGFKRRKSLSVADGKGKTVSGDRANVQKGALSLELLASVRNSESLSICRGAQGKVLEGTYNCSKSERCKLGSCTLLSRLPLKPRWRKR